MFSIIILIVLLFGFLRGLKRGFVMQLMQMVSFVLAFVVASIFYKTIAEKISLWIPYPEITNDTLLAVFLNTMPLESAFNNAIAFALVFFMTRIVLQIITYMFDSITRLPLLRSVNSLFGGLLGFVEVYVVLFIFLFIFALVPIDMIQTYIDDSFLAKVMIEHTPILSKFVESLWFVDILS